MISDLIRQWGGVGFVAIVSILLSFLLGRVLGPFEFGTYSFVLSVVSIFAIVQDGGFKTLLFREKVKSSNSTFIEYDIFCTATVHIVLITCAGLICLFVFPISNTNILFPAVLFTGIRVYATYYSAQLKGEGRFGYEAFWQVMIRVVTASAMLSVLFIFSTSVALLFWAGAISLFLLVLFLVPGKSIKKFKIQHYQHLFRNTAFFFVIDAATVIYFRSDIILIKYIHPESLETGYYAAAYRLLEGVILMIAPVSQICFRYLRLHLNQKEKFAGLLKIMLSGALLAGMFFSFIGYLFGPRLTTLLYGIEFAKAGILSQWIFLSLLFVIPNSILTQALIALNFEKKYAAAAIIVAIINIVINFCVIPKYGAIGSVWATLVSEAFLFVILFGSIFRIFKRNT